MAGSIRFGRMAVLGVAGVLAAAVAIVAPASAQTHASATPSGDVTPVVSCDLSGDRQRADDCIRVSLTKSARDGRIAEDKVISARIKIDPSLRGRNMVTKIQARRLSTIGKPGHWFTIRNVMWEAKSRSKSLDVDVCTAALKGKYQLRTRTQINAGVTRSGTSSSVAISLPITLNVEGNPATCVSSPQDMTIVEYFNQMSFEGLIDVVVEDAGPQFNVIINCPEPVSSTIPPQSMTLALYTSDQAYATSCTNQTPIVISKAALQADQLDYCRGLECDFGIVLFNNVTYTIYSNTLYQITMNPGNETYVPSLEPAVIPVCNAPVEPCVLEGTCVLSTPKSGVLQLCDSADSSACSSPNTTYTYNETIYFELALTHRTT